MLETNKLRKIQDCKGRLKEIVGDEGVLQLAKDGICPHYIITNPITKEESIWFIASEINEWFDKNFVNYRDGLFVQNYTFLHFNKELHKVRGQIPEELSRIKELYHLPMENISTPPGIYFLCKNNKIQYIGQAGNVANRVITHITEGLKDFDSVYFISCSINRLTELESSLIRYFQPELNRTCRINPSQRDVMIVQSMFDESND
jgi:hypothetical protein